MSNFMEERNMSLKIALLQIAPTDSLCGNLKKGLDACRQAKSKGADLVVFPEMWSNGYEHLFHGYLEEQTNLTESKIEEWQDKAVAENSEFVKAFATCAEKLKMAIAITFLERTKVQPLNTVIVFDRQGKKVLKYSKVQTVDFKMEYYTSQGDSLDVAELDYGKGRIKIGALICNDINHPEVARILMIKGAEVIIVPNACKYYRIRQDIVKVRSHENAVVAVLVNYPIESKTLNSGNGMSCAYSPIFRIENGDEINTALVEMGEREEIAVIDVDVDALREYRATCSLGDAYRKPKMYVELLNEKATEPFIRKYSRR